MKRFLSILSVFILFISFETYAQRYTFLDKSIYSFDVGYGYLYNANVGDAKNCVNLGLSVYSFHVGYTVNLSNRHNVKHNYYGIDKDTGRNNYFNVRLGYDFNIYGNEHKKHRFFFTPLIGGSLIQDLVYVIGPTAKESKLEIGNNITKVSYGGQLSYKFKYLKTSIMCTNELIGISIGYSDSLPF